MRTLPDLVVQRVPVRIGGRLVQPAVAAAIAAAALVLGIVTASGGITWFAAAVLVGFSLSGST